MLSGCSVPDALNPIKWYEGVADAVAGDETAPPESEAEFPNLGTVPEAPEDVTTAEDFEAVAEGLAADRENAQYTDETIRRADDEVEGELALAEPVEQPPAEAEASTISEVMPEPEPEPEPAEPVTEPVAAEAAPAPAKTLSGEEAMPAQRAVAVPAEPLPGASAGDVTAMFYAAYAASGAKTLPGAAAVSTTTPSAAPAAPASASWAAPTRLVGSIGFAEGSSRLDSRARSGLLELAHLYGATGGPIRIVGHASPTGPSDETARKIANLDIALDRALAVARKLERLGVPAAAMTVEAQPEAGTNALAAGAAGGRRVDVYLVP
jgi:outer membrane protein OmpA-like peptidoglycan-associated protein